jgi:hypothetical protein
MPHICSLDHPNFNRTEREFAHYCVDDSLSPSCLPHTVQALQYHERRRIQREQWADPVHRGQNGINFRPPTQNAPIKQMVRSLEHRESDLAKANIQSQYSGCPSLHLHQARPIMGFFLSRRQSNLRALLLARGLSLDSAFIAVTFVSNRAP